MNTFNVTRPNKIKTVRDAEKISKLVEDIVRTQDGEL